MARFVLLILALVVGLFLSASPAQAGMPMFTLTDLARLRVSTISFFLLVYLLASFAMWKLWNFLGKDFPKLPRLSFTQALGLVLLWGLAFQLVLVMVAGTRELMTPEAWERAGVIYKVVPDSQMQLLDARRHKLDRLRVALWQFAEKHKGQFPAKQHDDLLPDDVWLTPDGKGRYLYMTGVSQDKGMAPLAYEPDTFGHERMVLFANGAIELLPVDVIQNLLKTSGS